MSAKELAVLVAKMRLAQRTYFKLREPESLAEAKLLEKQVDQAVDEGKGCSMNECSDRVNHTFGATPTLDVQRARAQAEIPGPPANPRLT